MPDGPGVCGWDNCPESIRAAVYGLVSVFEGVLGDSLAGAYLHGSLAMGCFNPARSDIDLLVVSGEPLSDQHKQTIINHLVATREEAPPKGVEMSIILEQTAKHPVHPTPFELHYSNDWFQRYSRGEVDYIRPGTDEDLAAHFTVTRERGIRLQGRPIVEVFAEVPRTLYVQSLLADAIWIYGRYESNPVYAILNLCRIMAFLKDRIVTSKKEGGEWALRSLPAEYHTLVRWALDAYGGTGTESPVQSLADFVAFARAQIDTLASKWG